MSDPLILSVESRHPSSPEPDYAIITDAIAAEIVRRALAHDDAVRAGIRGLIQRLQENTKPAAVDPPGHIDDRDREDWFKREITELRAKLATYENDRHHEIVKAQRDKALAELASTIEDAIEERNGYANENHFLKKERDAARAEADALLAEASKLKARKVRLPKHMPISNTDPQDLYYFKDGHRSALEECADAIRAAGVEVES